MSLFSFFKKKPKAQSPPETNILLAMPMFNNGDGYDVDKVIADLASQWNLTATDIEGDQDVTTFGINGETVAIAYMPVPIPWADIEGTAQYAYNWTKAAEELKEHTGHAIVSIMAGQGSTLERFTILSKVLCSILNVSDAVGVYQGSQSLLIPRQQYLNHTEELQNGDVPVMLWIYIGLRKIATGNCTYTYGLKDFQKQEIEIIDSAQSLDELYGFMSNIAAYVIGNDVTLKAGETLGSTAEQKMPITLSKGRFVEGESLKIGA
jgi:hypothetical protein